MYGQGNYPPQFRAPQQIRPGPLSHPPQYQYNIPPQQASHPSLHSHLPPPPPPFILPLPPPPSISPLPPPPCRPLPPPPPYPSTSTLIHVRAPTPPFSSNFVPISPVPPPSCVPPPPPPCAQPPPPSCAAPAPPPPPPSSPPPPPPPPPFSPDATQKASFFDTASADIAKVSNDIEGDKPGNWDDNFLPSSKDETMVNNIEANKEGATTSLDARDMDIEDGAGRFNLEEANDSLSKKSPGDAVSAGNESDGSKEAFHATTAGASEQRALQTLAVLHDAEDAKNSSQDASPSIISANTAGQPSMSITEGSTVKPIDNASKMNENPICLLQGYASDDSEEDADGKSQMKIVDSKSSNADFNQLSPLDNHPEKASMVDETSKCELSQKNVDSFGKHHIEKENANQTFSDGQLTKKGPSDGDFRQDHLNERHKKRERDGSCSPRSEKQIRFNSSSPWNHSLHHKDINPASLSQPSAAPYSFQQTPPPLHHFSSPPPNNIFPPRPHITSEFHSSRYTVLPPPPPPPRNDIHPILHHTAPHSATLHPHMPPQQPPLHVDDLSRPLPISKHLDPPFVRDDRSRFHLQKPYPSPVKDLPFSSNHLPPYGLADRIPSSFLEYRATHYNPFASTFEQVPPTSKFDSSRFSLDRVLKGGTELDLTSLSVTKPIIASDAYDPLFDSVEPSSSSKKIEPVIGSSHKSKEDEDSSSKQHKSEEDENGEAAIDAEVGVVENASPQYVNESLEHLKVDEGNTVDHTEKSVKSKDSRSMKLFKTALADFVKEVLKPSWKQGTISKEAFKTIVRKTVEKVSAGMASHQIPKSQAKINQYIESSQRKLTKLVMGYVDKYVKL